MSDTNQALTRLSLDGREFILIGTAHISQESVDTVTAAIVAEQPDTVCVELDAQRYQALKNRNRWEALNLIEVIRKGQAPFLMANLALSSFQKRLGLHTGVKPGAELAAAAETAEEKGMHVELVDRNLRVTLLRAWRKTGFFKKMVLMSSLLGSIFEDQKIDEEELNRLRQTDTLSAMLEEMAEMLPTVKTILVDERDMYMAHHIRHAPGEKILAVVGAAHLPGITRRLHEELSTEVLEEIGTLPPKSLFSRMIPWLIPSIVVLLFIVGFFFGDRSRVADAALAWVLANGVLSALGTLLAFGHPLTILSAFIAAPITSLNPTIGAGFITGIVQAFIVPPTVGDMERVGDDLVTFKGWWSNRLARVLLVFVLSSLGSVAGTFLAFHWLKDLL